jgi:hypothetical protein
MVCTAVPKQACGICKLYIMYGWICLIGACTCFVTVQMCARDVSIEADACGCAPLHVQALQLLLPCAPGSNAFQQHLHSPLPLLIFTSLVLCKVLDNRV